MRQHTDRIASKNVFNRMLKQYSLIALTFLCLSGGKAYGDSTYFPEDMEATDEVADNTEENSAAIKEWADLQPPKKQAAEGLPAKKEAKNEVSLVEQQRPTLEKREIQKSAPASAEAVKPSNPPTLDPKTPLASEKQKPSSVSTPVAAITAPTPTPTATAPTTAAATVTPSSKEPQPLQLTTVEPRSKALPVKDQAAEQAIAKKTVLSYSDAANDRAPLGILERAQEVHNQKWYIYSSAIRGLKNPSDKLQVVSMEGSPSNRGEEIRDLLVEMGIEPEKIQLIHGTGEENQRGMTYIFAGK